MERQRMGYDQRRAGIDSPEEAFAPDGANRGETEPGGVSELVDQPWWEGGSTHDEADDDKPRDAGGARQATPEPHKSRPGGYMYRGLTYGAAASEPEPGAASSGDDEPPDEAVLAIMSEEPAGGPAAGEGAQADPALDSPWWREGARPVDAAAQAPGAGEDEEERPGLAVSVPAGYGGPASEPEPGAASDGGGDEPPDEAGAAAVPEERAGGPAAEEGAPADPALDSPWRREGSRPVDAAAQAPGAGEDEEERPGPAVSVPAGYGGPASEPEPGAASDGGDE
ncbi:MAG: hypothetical protein OXE53_15450, partial [Deltaproteobacteria bacterium]|nr:hypothetical protein [Deltaproteobacteria bacterium]